MNYLEHYKEARNYYRINHQAPSVEDFHKFTCFPHYHKLFDTSHIDNIVEHVRPKFEADSKLYLDKKDNSLACQYKGNIFNIGIEEITDELLPQLEYDLYGCNIFVDKIYIYRNIYSSVPSSSWIWHYDNNPPSVYKIMIYLTDVNDANDAPFEYVEHDVRKPSRTGPKHWKAPPNNSRVSDINKENIQTVCGQKGHVLVFNPNCVHRATIPASGKYRDVLVIRVKPTITPVKKYMNTSYTTTFGVTGACPQDPRTKRCGA